MSTSFIYRYGTVYELLMRGLYGRHYGARYRAIAALVPENAAVLDLCCGPATLYTRYLRQKAVRYTGLDLNERFIARLIRAGGSGQVWNLRADTPLPAADYVIMQGSLFHFLPDPEPVLDRMLDAARERVIVAEPVRNLTATRHRAMAGLGGRLTDAGDGARPLRFDEETLDELFRGFPEHVEERRLIAGGREKLYLLKP
ncbi:methionine biosynthesis protein MetW [Nocardia otitidiscaviarum]|uniref:Methionine biosynthesis protein MetW n=1 Tax=Nocardia otitidiscaviarum TaxID=1823 RepID=A0A379JIK2_9NOCA|nr:methionine biosynthesis protein MetW [Nocardia otitidiscaviarum]SUD48338.1 methionine biosynthesis protein MetW [Nocardia otitidiscaviarum]